MRLGLARLLLVSAAFHLGVILVVLGWGPASRPSPQEQPGAAKLVYETEPAAPKSVVPLHRVASLPEKPVQPTRTLPLVSHQSVIVATTSIAKPEAPAPAESTIRSNDHDSIVFLVDISGSMYEPYGASTRVALARELVASHIRGLKDGTPFAVVVYGETALESGPLRVATTATRQAALQFLAAADDCGGGTNLPVALLSARELHPAAIFLATDGDLNMEGRELLPRALQILGPSGAAPRFDIVGIGPRPHTDAQRLLQSLADQEGGTYQTQENETLATSSAAP